MTGSIGAGFVATHLLGGRDRSATLSKMPAQMTDALGRGRRGSAGRP